MKHRTKRKVLILALVILLGGASVYWFLIQGDPEQEIEMNLPTASELERMEEIGRSTNQVAPDARPGVGVLPPGSTPVAEPEEGDETADEDAGAELVEEAPED